MSGSFRAEIALLKVQQAEAFAVSQRQTTLDQIAEELPASARAAALLVLEDQWPHGGGLETDHIRRIRSEVESSASASGSALKGRVRDIAWPPSSDAGDRATVDRIDEVMQLELQSAADAIAAVLVAHGFDPKPRDPHKQTLIVPKQMYALKTLEAAAAAQHVLDAARRTLEEARRDRDVSKINDAWGWGS